MATKRRTAQPGDVKFVRLGYATYDVAVRETGVVIGRVWKDRDGAWMGRRAGKFRSQVVGGSRRQAARWLSAQVALERMSRARLTRDPSAY